jgi:magnesium-transporting ATPase (P-type)
VGIAGKEGNQAANFSDYAIQNFQGLNRLIFWHGRQFGAKSNNFVSLNIFKNTAFVFSNIFFNTLNGFSGFALIDDFYFSF